MTASAKPQPVVLVGATAAGEPGRRATACALGVAIASLPASYSAGAGSGSYSGGVRSRGRGEGDSGAVVLDAGPGGWRPRPTMLATGSARSLAGVLGERGIASAARGRLCVAGGEIEALLAGAPAGDPRPLVVSLPAAGFAAARDRLVASGRLAGVLLQATSGDSRALMTLFARENIGLGVPTKVWRMEPGIVQARRATAGLEPRGRTSRLARRAAFAFTRNQGGQALPLLLGAVLVALVAALALVALAGGATAKGRAQRAADLAALSAARVMHNHFERLFVPATFGDGRPNPRHLPRDQYLRLARRAGTGAAVRNGLPAGAVAVSFPDRESFAPVRVRVEAELEVGVGEGPRPAADVETGSTTVAAVAALDPPSDPAAVAGPGGDEYATGGGYAGPLASRQGVPMRPDTADAFDRMARAAAASGVSLVINSGFRSDEEQAALFAANPDPRWVAPPGRSLHRCATELDIGPPAAYGWLAANAGRFGFVQRYSWEPWHYGFDRGPEPCSAAAESRSRALGDRADGRASGSRGLPGYVPPAYRGSLLEAASRNDVPVALLAAQLMAESNFNPAAVSPAGARGIAQFMPGTAAAYGLRDPFDPRQAIAAQGRLMGDLLRQFGSPQLALAAYNAGPGAVSACGCIPPYPETRAYVARIMGMLDGAGIVVGGAQGAGGDLVVRLIE